MMINLHSKPTEIACRDFTDLYVTAWSWRPRLTFELETAFQIIRTSPKDDVGDQQVAFRCSDEHYGLRRTHLRRLPQRQAADLTSRAEQGVLLVAMTCLEVVLGEVVGM